MAKITTIRAPFLLGPLLGGVRGGSPSIFGQNETALPQFWGEQNFLASPKVDTAGEINICLDIGQPVGPRAAKREHRVAANGTPCHQLTKRTI
ncbi:hypothetical protein, partial [Moorena sp. SIO3I8]|uniref:hypothetical protein n=1 Tax=Moorena sp. SIO3I8 TaxID=2607833 RepID=UPI0025E3A356